MAIFVTWNFGRRIMSKIIIKFLFQNLEIVRKLNWYYIRQLIVQNSASVVLTA